MPNTKRRKTNYNSHHSPPYHHHNHIHQNHNQNQNQNLTHDQIWDDSSLISSWNNAVKEYEYYHSLVARGVEGEALEGLLDRVENGEDEVGNGVDGVEDGEVEEEGEVADEDKVLEEAHVEGDEEGEIPEDPPTIEIFQPNNNILSSSSSKPSSCTPNTTNDPSELAKRKQAALQNIRLPDEMRGHTSAITNLDKNVNLNGHGQEATMLPGTATFPNGEQNATHAVPEQVNQDQTLENIKMAYYWAGYYSGLHDGQRQRQQ